MPRIDQRIGRAAKRAWGSEANPFTQANNIERPTASNFQLYGDPYGAQNQQNRASALGVTATQQQQRAQEGGMGSAAQQGRAQGLAQGQHELGQVAMDQAGMQRAQGAGFQSRGGIYLGNTDPGRNTAQSGVNNLNWFARQGEGPSAAEALLRNQAASNQRQAMSMARSGRGTGSAEAMRAALAGNAIAQGQTTNQAAALRAQEQQAFRGQQLAALQTAGGLGGQLYGQDIGRAQAASQIALQQRGQNDAMTLGMGQQALGYENLGLGRTGAAANFESLGQGYGQQQLGWEQLGQGYGAQNIAYENLGKDYAGMDLAGRMGYEQAITDRSTARAQIEAQRDSSLTGMAIGAIGGMAALSDVRAKEDISTADVVSQMAPFLGSGSGIASAMAGYAQDRDAREDERRRALGQAAGGAGFDASNMVSDVRNKRDISPAQATAAGSPAYEYSYRDPRNGEGRMVGPMAQDVERTPLGNTLVSEGPDGKKRLDGGRAGLVSLSAVGEQQQQLQAQQAELEDLRQRVAALSAAPTSDASWRDFYAQSSDLDAMAARAVALGENASRDDAWRRWEGR